MLKKTKEKLLGVVKEIIKEPSNSAPKALVKFDNIIAPIPAPLNLRENDLVSFNQNHKDAKIVMLKLKDINEEPLNLNDNKKISTNHYT